LAFLAAFSFVADFLRNVQSVCQRLQTNATNYVFF
jgi:hypothetical protein